MTAEAELDKLRWWTMECHVEHTRILIKSAKLAALVKNFEVCQFRGLC
jgi:hypothetical protein